MMERDLYGLTVNCDVSEIEDFASLRALLEPTIRKLTGIISEKQHTNMDSNFVKVPGDNPYYLTFCVYGSKIEFGLYDKNTKKISDSCNWGDIKELGYSELNRLTNILENYIKNQIKMPSLNALDIAWKEEMLKRRTKSITADRPDTKESDTDIFEKRLSHLKAPPAQEKKPSRFIAPSADAR